jgi:alcohol dehydrogenase
VKTTAAVLVEMGRETPYEASMPLVVEELELAGPGEGEVLVEIAAAGLCHSDLSVIDGSRPRPVPMVLGHEAAGVVRELGAGVKSFYEGDHVIFSFVPSCGHCEFCANSRPALCLQGARANLEGALLSGARRLSWQSRPVHHHLGVSGFATLTVAAQESLVKIDPAFPLDKAALFGCAIVTGVGAIVNTAQVSSGSSVAVFGLGGVGLAVVMGADLAGAHPIIAVDISEAKLEHALSLGATHTVNARDTDAVVAVREITQGGAAYGFEAAGRAEVLEQAYLATRRGGTTVTVGLPAPEAKISLPAVHLTAEERTLKGSFMGSCVPRRDIPRFIGLYQAGKLPADGLVTHTLALEEINKGFDRLASGEAVRQILLPRGL